MEGLILKSKSIHPFIPPISVTSEKPTTIKNSKTLNVNLKKHTPSSTLGSTILYFDRTMGQGKSTTTPNIYENITLLPTSHWINISNLNYRTTTASSKTLTSNNTFDNLNLSDISWSENEETLLWNDSWLNGTNITNFNNSDFELWNATARGFWFCAEWTAAQQDIFQTAHLFIALAFLIPHSFKQSGLVVRALLSLGFLLAALWAGSDICAPDVVTWNLTLMSVNVVHTIILIVRFIPPTQSVDNTELYIKLFKPLKVSKKHFSELTREARLLRLERDDPYALEDVTPADERLSILLKGKLKVSCDNTHLHYISPHQFIDSPEWEANHEHSDDVFQVTITAQEDCTYLCWPRMKLERVLRHRPMLKVVLDSIIGKDITLKLYSLNEHLSAAAGSGVTGNGRDKNEGEGWAGSLIRSLSVDAVNTGSHGHVRSMVYRTQKNRRDSFAASDNCSPARKWIPVVANQFPLTSPFPQARILSQIPSIPSGMVLVTPTHVLHSSQAMFTPIHTPGFPTVAPPPMFTPVPPSGYAPPTISNPGVVTIAPPPMFTPVHTPGFPTVAPPPMFTPVPTTGYPTIAPPPMYTPITRPGLSSVATPPLFTPIHTIAPPTIAPPRLATQAAVVIPILAPPPSAPRPQRKTREVKFIEPKVKTKQRQDKLICDSAV